MDLQAYRNSILDKLSEDTDFSEAQKCCNMLQVIDCTEKSKIEHDIKKANLEKLQAEISLNKSEEKTQKVERFTKIGGLVLTGLGTVVTAATLVIINGMNIESHKDEVMKYSDDERDRERNISGKLLDLFIKKR